jgi:hypothetical protein
MHRTRSLLGAGLLETHQWLIQGAQHGPGMTNVISAGNGPPATLIRWSGLDSRDSITLPASTWKCDAVDDRSYTDLLEPVGGRPW